MPEAKAKAAPFDYYRPIKLFLVMLAIVFALYAFFVVRNAVVILVIACMVAAALHPAIGWLQRKGIPRSLGVAGVFVLFILGAGALGFVLGSILLDQGHQFIEHLPAYTDAAIEKLKAIPYLQTQGDLLQKATQQMGGIAAKGGAVIFSSLAYVFGVLGSVLSVFTVLIFSFFLLSETEYYQKTFYNLLPAPERDRIFRVVTKIATQVGAYVRGQLIVVSITGVIVAVGLTFMHIPYAYILGILTALFDIIPVVGPAIAIAFGLLITAGSDPGMLLWVLILYLIAQQIENGVVFPFVMGKSINIHASWILLSILIVSPLIGVSGVILAVPIAIAINILLQEYYVDGYLAKRQPVGDIQAVSEQTKS